MKKFAIALLTTCMLLTTSSFASASAPVNEKQHEVKMHIKKVEDKKHKMHAKSLKKHKLHAKALKKHKMHAKSIGHIKKLEVNGIHAKTLRAKDVTEMPKTGFGGASEKTE